MSFVRAARAVIEVGGSVSRRGNGVNRHCGGREQEYLGTLPESGGHGIVIRVMLIFGNGHEGALQRDKVGLGLEAQVIQELRCRWPGGLEVPYLVKDRVMTRFDNTQCYIEVDNIAVGGGVPKKNASKVMAVELALLRTSPLDADSRAKCFEICNIWFAGIPTLEWHSSSCRANESVM